MDDLALFTRAIAMNDKATVNMYLVRMAAIDRHNNS